MKFNQVGNYRWRILALLFFSTTINYIDRQVLGLLKPYISNDINLGDDEYGYIVTAFQIAYAFGLIYCGRFIDKVGTRLGYVWAILVWSVAAMAHAFARGVASFSAARFILGIGEAANFPAAVKTTAYWFPKKERALASGLFNSGSSIGAIIAPVIVAGITVTWGWQWAFIITGSLGFIWIVFWLIFYYVPVEHPKISKAELDYIHQDSEMPIVEKRVRWTDYLKYRQTIAICVTRFISDWVWWFFLFWTPDYLNKTHGVNIKEVVLPLIIIYTMAAIGGIGGGWFSYFFIKKGRSINYSRKAAVLICALIVLPIMFVTQIHNIWIAVILIAFAAGGHQGWASNIFTIVSDIYPKEAVGSMIGLSGFAGAIGGALSATFIGLLLDKTGSYFLIFLLASTVYVMNWLILRIFIPKITPIGT
jgi:MFS transporter, ACS family, hexuronate transporter